MSLKVEKIVERLKTKREETVAFFEGLSPREWKQQVYTDGSAWDARQVLAHFVTAEREYLTIFKDVLEGGEGAAEDFDIDGFNEEQVSALADKSADELMAEFLNVRADMITLVEGIDASDLEIEARHPFFGWDKVEKFLKLIYRHNMIHERDIRAALKGGGA